MSLIDFGACREYRKDFVDDYLRLVWAAANRDDPEIMRVRPADACRWLGAHLGEQDAEWVRVLVCWLLKGIS